MTAPPQNTVVTTVRIADYAQITAALTVYCSGLAYMIANASTVSPDPMRVIAPITALVVLTGVIWVMMVVVRNATVIRGITNMDYYRDYSVFAPPEWVERPARTFNNLLQVPVLFYLVCVLMLVTKRFDQAQLMLAWAYVAVRVLHATILIGWNYVPYRFGSWLASCITLCIIWVRFLNQI